MIAEANPKLSDQLWADLRGEVLICDDEPDICETLAYFLEKRGFQPRITHQGDDCVRLAFQHRPAAILLDINLPDVSGLEVCAQLADAPQTRDIPIIMLSANGQADTVQQVRRSGAKFYIRKPYDPNTVIVLLEQAIHDAHAW